MIFLKANNLEILKGVGTMKNKHNKEKNVSSSSNDQLTGLDNKRLTKKEPSHNEGTAAWANDEKLQDRTNVLIPSDYSVNKAKNWVDNGSQT